MHTKCKVHKNERNKLCVPHQRVFIGVVEQPAFSQNVAPAPLGVMHRLDQSHEWDVGAETRTYGGAEN